MDTASERDRLAALHDLALLDTPPEERFDRIVRLAQQIFDVPVAAVNLVDEDRLFTKAGIGLEPGTEIPRSVGFCATTIESADALVVDDLGGDGRFADNPLVTDGPRMRFYAGQPLAAPGGQRVGTLCLLDSKPRELTDAQTTLLRELADLVEQELASDEELNQAREIQRRLLPRSAPDVPGYDVAGRCVPARHIGGDFFDWHFNGEEFQFVVADVMGKGLGAGLLAASTRAVLRGASRFNRLDEAVRRSAWSLDRDLTETSTFVTLFAARLTPETGRLEYVDAGHGLAIVIPAEGEARHVASDDLPLGAVPDDSWALCHEQLDPGDTLVVVSDGILEFFPDPDAAVDAAVALCRRIDDGWDMVNQIISVGAGRSVPDDITALVVHRY